MNSYVYKRKKHLKCIKISNNLNKNYYYYQLTLSELLEFHWLEQVFHMPDGIRVTQPTASKYWRK